MTTRPRSASASRVAVHVCLVLSLSHSSDGEAATSSARRIPPPPLVMPGVRLLNVLRYDTVEAARAAWRAGTRSDDAGARLAKESTAGVNPMTIGGRPVLKMRCNFKGTTMPRAVWDCRVSLDLRLASAVIFDVYAENLSAIGSCNLYIQSGDGWYSGRWYPGTENAWTRIRIRKSDFHVDKPAAGWSKVQAIRMSPSAIKREDAVLYVANLGAEEPETAAIIVRQEYAAGDEAGDQKTATKHTSTVGDLLDDAGVVLPMVSTMGLTEELLQGKKLVILPYASGMAPEPTKTLVDFVRAGGKIIACFSPPRPLASLLGVSLEGYRSRTTANEFSSIRFAETPPPGAPQEVKQSSWGIIQSRPVPGRGRVAAWWHAQDGIRTDAPAIVLSDNGAYVSHVVLRDDAKKKVALLAALAERFCPGVHKQMIRKQIARLGSAVGAHSWRDAVALVSRLPAFNEKAAAVLAKAQGRFARAHKTAAAGEHLQALPMADEANELLVEAYCLSQRAGPPEFRATWCHSPEGIPGWSWDRTASQLAQAGINHLFLNALRGLSTSYPSRVLPYHAEYGNTRPDWLARSIEACRKHGIKVHVWMTNYQPGSVGKHVPKAFIERLRAEGRTQVDRDGAITNYLCPSHDQNLLMQLKAMVEAARKPGVAGIHFDYIRYPNEHTCFCKTCRARFEPGLGHPVKNWPGDVLANGPVRRAWRQFRCDNITRLVRWVHREVRRVAPQCRISAAVFKDYPNCKDTVGQDWMLWIREGYLDFVCPMDYTASDAQFNNLVADQMALVRGKVPCYPGIGLLKGLGPVGTIRQIQITRRHRTGGFAIWSVHPQYINAVYPYLGKGITTRTRSSCKP
jgi:uncharacterized lipoprotein YddW (UPF0748 family)